MATPRRVIRSYGPLLIRAAPRGVWICGCSDALKDNPRRFDLDRRVPARQVAGEGLYGAAH